MPRVPKFNQSKRLKKYVASRRRDPTNNQLLKTDVHVAQQSVEPLTAVCCTCGLEASEGLLLQIAEYSNEVYCGSCFHSCSTTCWWGSDDSAGEDDECADSFDAHISDSVAIHTLTGNQTWKEGMETLEYLMCKSQENARLMPSIRKSKTPYYSMVSIGNQYGTFAHESQAVKMTTDRLRKQIQRKANSEHEREEACRKVKMRQLNKYFASQRTDNTLVTRDSYEIDSETLARMRRGKLWSKSVRQS